MSIVTRPSLARPDAAVLSEAVSLHQGRIVLPETMTPLRAKRLIGRLLNAGLVEPRNEAGETAHELTPAGYAALGMTPPLPPVANDVAAPEAVSKREVVLGLLGRTDGASLSELIAATGWLPHTTRAALSRLRSAGQVLAKTQRGDGATAYRIMPKEPTPGPRLARGSARRKGAADHTASA